MPKIWSVGQKRLINEKRLPKCLYPPPPPLQKRHQMFKAKNYPPCRLIIARNAAASGSEDIAFSMLQKKPGMSSSSLSKFPEERSPSSTGLAGLANYGSDSEDETSANQTSRLNDDSKHTDWSKLACLLCKRQFPTKEKLQKYVQIFTYVHNMFVVYTLFLIFTGTTKFPICISRIWTPGKSAN